MDYFNEFPKLSLATTLYLLIIVLPCGRLRELILISDQL